MLQHHTHENSRPPSTPNYPPSVHDALPIWPKFGCGLGQCGACTVIVRGRAVRSCMTPGNTVSGAEITTLEGLDRKSTRLNSSHLVISYAVFCLKKKHHNGHAIYSQALVHSG